MRTAVRTVRTGCPRVHVGLEYGLFVPPLRARLTSRAGVASLVSREPPASALLFLSFFFVCDLFCHVSFACLLVRRGKANFVVTWRGVKKQATANIVDIKKV